MEIATGYFIRLSEWNTRTHFVTSTSSQAKEINDHLQNQRAKITQLHNRLKSEEKPLTLAVIKNKLTDRDQKQTTLMIAITYHNELIKKGFGRNYAQKTCDAYRFFSPKMKVFLNYQYNRRDILLAELNHLFLAEFAYYLYQCTP